MGDESKTVFLFDVIRLYLGNYQDDDLKTQMLEILDAERASNRSVQRSNAGGFQTDDLCRSQLAPEFMKRMQSDISAYLKNYTVHTPFRAVLSGLWVNSNRKHHFNMPHNHSPDFFSGVWYLKVPKDSGGICFLNPVEQNTYNYHNFLGDGCFQDSATYNAKDNDLILFPSYVTHFVLPNVSDEERVSVAFNFNLAPTGG